MPRTKKTKKKTPTKPARKSSRTPPLTAEDVRSLRSHLVHLLSGEQAHAGPAKVLEDVPVNVRDIKIPGAVHTPWQLLEHLRIAQWDILEFCRNARHVSPPWPAGYWPPTPAPPDAAAWDRSVETFHADLRAMADLVKNPKADLFARIPHGQGQTILREAMLVADHNAYHLGQMVLLLRLAGVWESG